MGTNLITVNLATVKSLVQQAINTTITNQGLIDSTTLATTLTNYLQNTFADSLLTGINIYITSTGVDVDSSILDPATGSSSTVTQSVPLASENNAGIIPKETYQQILTNTADIAALSQLGGRFIGSFATNAALMAYVIQPADQRGNWAIVQADETHNGNEARWYLEDNGSGSLYWSLMSVINYTPTPKADNAGTSGTVTGLPFIAGNNSKIGIEANNTMSLIGWDYAMGLIGTAQSTANSALTTANAAQVAVGLPSAGPLSSAQVTNLAGAIARINNWMMGNYTTPYTVNANAFNATT